MTGRKVTAGMTGRRVAAEMTEGANLIKTRTRIHEFKRINTDYCLFAKPAGSFMVVSSF